MAVKVYPSDAEIFGVEVGWKCSEHIWWKERCAAATAKVAALHYLMFQAVCDMDGDMSNEDEGTCLDVQKS